MFDEAGEGPRLRLPTIGLSMLLFVVVGELVSLVVDVGEVSAVLFARVGVVFTGFRMHLLTCRLRFEATPNRRPQVSHTKAKESL